jgi:hypothetical protein
MGQGPVPRRKDRLVTRDIAGDTLIVPLASRPEDLNHLFVLNPVAAFIWSQIDGIRPRDEVVAGVRQAFEGSDGESIAQDVDAFFAELVRLGLVTLAEAAEASPPAAETRGV